MKVGTKVAAGAGLLTGLLIVALVRDMAHLRELASFHRSLSQDRFQAVTSTLEILRTLELSEERLQKLFVTRDPAYGAQLERLGATMDVQLAAQRARNLPPEEHAAVGAVEARWKAYQAAFAAGRETLVATGKLPERDTVRAQLTAGLDEARATAVDLLTALRDGLARDVANAQAEVDRSERLSWLLAGLAMASALLFVLLVVRSLNRPLARLIAATRNVATGTRTRLEPRGRDELAELARAFDLMMERLDEADEMKRDFLSRLSHELKTPLAAMQETNQLMVEELAGPLTGKQRRLLQLNLDAGRRLSAMLSRLLDLSRLDAGAVKYDVRRVDLRELLAVARHEFEARLQDRGLDHALEVPDAPVMLDADRDWLVQVVENLLENAVKFSPRGGTVRLAARTHPHASEVPGMPARAQAVLDWRPCAVLTVADEGPGIPTEAKERIFERFFQMQRKLRAGDGVGLGLAICRDIVAAHGGAIWVDDHEGGGSVFCVALPLADEMHDEPDAGSMGDSGDTREGADGASDDSVPVAVGRRVHPEPGAG